MSFAAAKTFSEGFYWLEELVQQLKFCYASLTLDETGNAFLLQQETWTNFWEENWEKFPSNKNARSMNNVFFVRKGNVLSFLFLLVISKLRL